MKTYKKRIFSSESLSLHLKRINYLTHTITFQKLVFIKYAQIRALLIYIYKAHIHSKKKKKKRNNP